MRAERPRLTEGLRAIGLKVEPSLANFVMARFPEEPGRTALEAEAFLTGEGILVRGLKGYGLPEALRITVGLPGHVDRVVEALGRFMAGRTT